MPGDRIRALVLRQAAGEMENAVRTKSESRIAPRFSIVHRRRSIHARRGEHDFFILDAPNWVNIIPLTSTGDIVMIASGVTGSASSRWKSRAAWSMPTMRRRCMRRGAR